MRQVNFISNERVDVPDMMAQTTLIIGEFRRLNRLVLQGEEANKIIRGFAVTAGPGANEATITFQGGGLDSSALFGGDDVYSEYGQLAGGRGIEANALEGPTSFVLDFTGQPNATYDVDVRFIYQDGAADNRVFINPATSTEFSASTNTRRLPMWEVRNFGDPVFNGHQTIATVVWDGGGVGGGDISDQRDFVFEGSDFEAPVPGDPGGMPDFVRTADRETVGVGLNTVYPLLRALGRQIQDGKGIDPATGQWNWFGRLPGLVDPYGDIGNAEITTNFSAESEHVYTVGDGSTSFGHFNGSAGLQNCLNLIALWADGVNPTTGYPARVKIILKSTGGNTTSPVFTCSTPVSLTNVSLTIEAADVGPRFDGLNGSIWPKSLPVAFTHGAGTPFFTLLGASSIKLKGLYGTTNMNELIDTGGAATVSRTELENCYFTFNDVQGIYCNDLHAKDLYISGGLHTIICGVLTVGGSSLDRCQFTYNSATTSKCHLRLWDDTGDTVVAADATTASKRIRFRQCVFGSHGQQATAGRPSVVDARGCQGISFEDCEVSVPSSQDFLWTGQINTTAAGQGSESITLGSCQIRGALATSHAVGAGFNGAKGTGWTVFGDQIDSTNPTRSVSIKDCTWFTYQGVDAGGVYQRGTRGLKVTGCDWLGVQMTAASRWAAVEVAAFGTESAAARIDNIRVTNPFGTANQAYVGVRIQGALKNVKVSNSTFECSDGATSYDGANSGGLATSGAIVGYGLLGGGAIKDISIQGCHFYDWDFNAGSTTIYFECADTPGLNISLNTFDSCILCIYLFCSGDAALTAQGNIHRLIEGDALLNGSGWNAGLYGSTITLLGNRAVYNIVPTLPWQWIDMLGAEDYQLFGNDGGVSGQIQGVGSGPGPTVRGRGYDEISQDVNMTAGYV